MKRVLQLTISRHFFFWSVIITAFICIGLYQKSLGDAPLMLDADLIRVGISNESMTQLEYTSVTLSATGPYHIRTGNKIVWEGTGFTNITITKTSRGFLIHSLGPFPGPLTVEPTTPEVTRLKILSINRKGKAPSYKGILEILPASSSAEKLIVVNVLPMQEYLKAVVPNELPIQYGYEAVKAQAVAARNYAIHPREKPWPQFDICDSQYCQAYYGSQTENPQVTQALADTQGLIALYQGEPILALYSSAQGGYRENYEFTFSDPYTNKFPATPIPYLIGGPDTGASLDLTTEAGAKAFYKTPYPDSYELASPMYRWHKTWKTREFESDINHNLSAAWKDTSTRPFIYPAFAPGSKIGTLKDISVIKRGVSGKAMQLSITGSRGTWTLSKEFVIRKVLKHQGKLLPSANIVFEIGRNKHGKITSISAYGGGMGHGVGMSQLGASYMSKHGYGFTDILKHYYPGIAIGTIPLTATPTAGMKTTFYVSNPHGILFVKGNTPVQILLNNNPITISPQTQSSLLVDTFLAPHTLNQLEVKPLQSGTSANIWIEL